LKSSSEIICIELPLSINAETFKVLKRTFRNKNFELLQTFGDPSLSMSFVTELSENVDELYL